MPGIDGIEATSKIRENEGKLELPTSIIIALTAAECKKGRLRTEYKQFGFNELVSKPLSRKEFNNLVSKYIH